MTTVTRITNEITHFKITPDGDGPKVLEFCTHGDRTIFEAHLSPASLLVLAEGIVNAFEKAEESKR